MPIADDNPRDANRGYWVDTHHPIGGPVSFRVGRLDPHDPAAVAEICRELERRELDWPPPAEFAEATLRRFRGAALAAHRTPGERAADQYARLEAKWALQGRDYRAERGRLRQERGRLRQERIEACSRPVAGVRVEPPETVASEAGDVTARQLQAVAAGGRPLGGPYRLECDLTQGEQRILGPGGAELGVVRARGFEAFDGGLAWAVGLVERDLRRGPRRGRRAYEVEAGVDGGPRDGLHLGAQQVEARTSAQALRAVPARQFASRLDPGERAMLLSAIALDDPGDYSYAVHRVRARERGAGHAQPERVVSFER